ncbi:MAG TPA: condensation domain-containing protein, partial [Chitinophaga sp.]|uniref:condensation domain-containing protein n=1 Tax=Chitinophaga sp. TaxID=1869181 RepID=UPI002D013358
DLRKHLAAFLPDYMVPAFFIIMDSFPLTGNGKIDRKRLPIPQETNLSTAGYEAPVTDTEQQLAALWTKLLHVQRVGLNDHFFELGGHSLKAVNAIAEIFRTFQVNLPLNLFFQKATVKEQAAFIDKQQKQQVEQLAIAPVQAFYPQSSSQKRLYLLHQIEGSENSYNIPRAFQVKGNIDTARLEQCFATLIARHDALRTSFEMRDGAPVQIIRDTVPFHIGYTEAAPQEKGRLIRSFVRTFDLAAPPLLRAQLFDFGANDLLFIFDMHHIISDGVSSALFTEELISLYNGEALEPVTFQYKDFAVWQNDLLLNNAFKDQESYWLQQFAEEAPVLSIQTDFPRPARKSFNGKRMQVGLSAEVCQQLDKLGMQWGYTLHQLLLAAFKVLLYKYSGNEDIVVGTPVAGRTRAELDKVLGVFINTLAIRSYPAGKKTFRDFLAEVSNTAVEALKNQDYPFELLIDKLDLKRDMSRNPLFDVMFSFLHEDRDSLPLGDAVLEPVTDIYDTSKFDLLLEGVRTGNHIRLNLEYSTDLFSAATAERFLQHYVNLLQEINSHLNSTLADINILQPAETQWLLTDCNDTAARYPEDICIHQLFEEQVKRHPDNVALVFEDKQLTYAALDAKATQLAAAIQEAMPANENQVIAVMLDRSPEMI